MVSCRCAMALNADGSSYLRALAIKEVMEAMQNNVTNKICISTDLLSRKQNFAIVLLIQTS